MYRIFGRGLPALFLLCANASRADPLTLAQAISQAQVKSPDIQSVQGQYDSASAKKRLALAPAEPSLAINWNDMTTPFRLGGTASQQFISSRRPWAFRGARGSTAPSSIDQAEATGEAASVDQAASLRQRQAGLLRPRARAEEHRAQRGSAPFLRADPGHRQAPLRDRRQQPGRLAERPGGAPSKYQRPGGSRGGRAAGARAAQRAAEKSRGRQARRQPRSRWKTGRRSISIRRWPGCSPTGNEIQAARDQVAASGKRVRSGVDVSFFRTSSSRRARRFYNVPQASPSAQYAGRERDRPLSHATPTWRACRSRSRSGFFVNEREAIVGASHDRAAAEANLDRAVRAVAGGAGERGRGDQRLPAQDRELRGAHAPDGRAVAEYRAHRYGAGKIDFQTLSDTATARRQIRLAYAKAIVTFLTNYATYGQLIGEDL